MRREVNDAESIFVENFAFRLRRTKRRPWQNKATTSDHLTAVRYVVVPKARPDELPGLGVSTSARQWITSTWPHNCAIHAVAVDYEQHRWPIWTGGHGTEP